MFDNHITTSLKRFGALVVLLQVSLGLVYAQGLPDTHASAAWQAFEKTHGDSWHVRWNSKTGNPAAIYGAKSNLFHGSPVQAAQSFLEDNSDLFRIRGELQLKHKWTKEHQGIYHVKFQQVYRGVPIKDATYQVHLDSEGRVDMANGTMYSAVEVDPTVSVRRPAAVQFAIDDVPVRGEVKQSRAQRIIYPHESSFHYAWKVLIDASPHGGMWEVIVNARNGAIIETHRRTISALSHDESPRESTVNVSGDVSSIKGGRNYGQFATGYGTVYKTHPGLTGISTEDLPRLLGPILGHYYMLKGKWAQVKEFGQYGDGDSFMQVGYDFTYPSTSERFGQVSLYYYIDRVRSEYWESLGMDEFGCIVARYLPGNTNPRYVSWGGGKSRDPENDLCKRGVDEYLGYLLIGDEFAKEDKVVYHEYTHAVMDQIEHEITAAWNEEGAVLEGTADYFATAYTGRTKIFEYSAPEHMRDAANPESSYSEIQNGEEPHAGGEFWSAVLWDLRQTMGLSGRDTDRLVLGALYRLDQDPTFLEFRDALLAEDVSRHNGTHDVTIQNVFADFGIGEAVPFTVTVAGGFCVDHGYTGSFFADVTSGSPPYSYRWEKATPCGAAYALPPGDECGRWYYAGSREQLDVYSTSDYLLRVRATDAAGDATWSPSHSVEVQSVCYSGGGASSKAAPSVEVPPPAPERAFLHANHPNPFAVRTRLEFGLPNSQDVRLVVYDVTGREVARLVQEPKSAGYHAVSWAPDDLPSGVYFARIQAGTFTDVRRMVLLR